jgi:hypothetical protein
MKIAEKELSRKDEFNNMLDFMCQQLELLKVIDSSSKNFEQRDILLNRALDVRSACMQYLAAYIRHDATFLGTTGTISSKYVKLIISGKVFKTFTLGDRSINEPMINLKSCVDNYCRAISSITYALVEKGIVLLSNMP